MSPCAQEAIGLAGFAANVAGNMLLAHKSQRGWGIRILSNILWLIYAGKSQSFAMAANGVTFMGINIYGWWTWRNSQRSAAATPTQTCAHCGANLPLDVACLLDARTGERYCAGTGCYRKGAMRGGETPFDGQRVDAREVKGVAKPNPTGGEHDCG